MSACPTFSLPALSMAVRRDFHRIFARRGTRLRRRLCVSQHHGHLWQRHPRSPGFRPALRRIRSRRPVRIGDRRRRRLYHPWRRPQRPLRSREKTLHHPRTSPLHGPRLTPPRGKQKLAQRRPKIRICDKSAKDMVIRSIASRGSMFFLAWECPNPCKSFEPACREFLNAGERMIVCFWRGCLTRNDSRPPE